MDTTLASYRHKVVISVSVYMCLDIVLDTLVLVVPCTPYGRPASKGNRTGYSIVV